MQVEQLTKPKIWEMVKEAIAALYHGEKVGYKEIKDWIIAKYGPHKDGTLNAQIIVSIVNHPSRVHYLENNKPRIANGRYDFLFLISKGQVVKYNPEEHGIWEIKFNEYGKLTVGQVINDEGSDIITPVDDTIDEYLFPWESHLRDFIVKNIKTIKFNNKSLRIYRDENSRDGVEYETSVAGIIDVLALDEDDNFVVFELKLERGPDRALGQLLRYMGWLTKEKANGKKVFGVIVAKKMDEKLKYAIIPTENIELFEYEIKFNISQVQK